MFNNMIIHLFSMMKLNSSMFRKTFFFAQHFEADDN
ncbi:hypothetical protein I656_01847 [Geobacillus sp. WSUCF1]|nr:hypothetical protein I656_01847 [Geobacillus sp. WSUCF1]